MHGGAQNCEVWIVLANLVACILTWFYDVLSNKRVNLVTLLGLIAQLLLLNFISVIYRIGHFYILLFKNEIFYLFLFVLSDFSGKISINRFLSFTLCSKFQNSEIPGIPGAAHYAAVKFNNPPRWPAVSVCSCKNKPQN